MVTTAIKQFPRGKAFCWFAHASLEYDLADILKTLGIAVVKANNDREHKERPCIPGYNDMDFGDDIRGRLQSMTCRAEDFEGTNFIFLMNTDKFHHQVAYLSQFKPVILYLFGQHLDLQLDEFAGKMNKQIDLGQNPNIFTVCYSKREYDYLMPRLYREVQHHLYHIRFAKRLEDYSPPSGFERLPFVYTSSNSIQNRGDQCGWPQLKEIRTKVPHLLSGHETDQVGGMGRISFDHLRKLYWTCSAYVTFPAWPAPLVMNLKEAMLAGAPTAFYDNGRGAADEGLFNDGVGCLSNNVDGLVSYCKRALTDRQFRIEQSAMCQDRAIQFYDFKRQIHRWVELFNEMEKLW